MRKITALKLADKRKQLVEISLDGELWRPVDAEAVVRLDLKVGDEIAVGVLRLIEEENSFILARKRAVNMCVARPRTVREITHDLIQRGFDERALERVLEELERQGLLDEREVARREVRHGERAHIGPRKVKADLVARGVPPDLSEEALGVLLDPRWQLREALALARQRSERLGKLDPDDRRKKLTAFLMRRGFEAEIVQEALRRAHLDDPEES